MASALIHLCVAKEVNKILKLNEKEFFLGNIAPDIAKQIGMDKKGPHFIDGTRCNSNNPNLDVFLDKYRNSLNNPFDLGYYCHLYTDLFWFGFYLLRYRVEYTIYYKDGHSEYLPYEDIKKVIYQEYEHLNPKLIDKYNLDLSLFYEDPPIIESNIEEIPIDKLNIIIEKMGLIIEESDNKPNLIFDEENIYEFIDFVSKSFIKHLKEIRVI